MATSLISPLECLICTDEFNSTTRRPKVLPCGHSFCGPCLQNCIDQNVSTCGICRAPHNAASSDDIPVNIGMEECIQMRSPSGIVEDTLREAQQNIDRIESVTANLERIFIERNDSVINKEAQITKLLEEIDDDKRVRDQAQEAAAEIESIHSQIKDCIDEVQRASEKREILKGCLELQNKIEHLSNLLVDIENKNDIVSLSQFQPKVSPLLLVTGTTHTVVYLDLQMEGRPLCRVRILLTCGPRRREQMVRLCTAPGGTNPSLSGSWFDRAMCVGQAGEYISCHGYITPGGGREYTALVQDLEQDTCQLATEGAVTGCVDNAIFRICTRTNPSFTVIMRNELGRVVSGMDILRRAMAQYTTWEEYDASQIRITEAGVE